MKKKSLKSSNINSHKGEIRRQFTTIIYSDSFLNLQDLPLSSHEHFAHIHTQQKEIFIHDCKSCVGNGNLNR